MKLRGPFVALGVAVIAVALSACAATGASSPSTLTVIAPVTRSVDELQGATVDLRVGQVLNMSTGDLAVDSYRGEVADPAVAAFVQGSDQGSAQFNPGVTAVAPGTTKVTMTNRNGGIQPLEFTVVVTAT